MHLPHEDERDERHETHLDVDYKHRCDLALALAIAV